MNIIITGGPGTGKTHLIKELIKKFPKFKASSTTNVSANLINGKTFYKTLRLTADFDDTKIHCKTKKTVIIDEASMLDRDIFLKLKYMFPFVNFILVGDWDQLPPVKGQFIQENDVDYVIKLSPHDKMRSKDPLLNDFIYRIKHNSIMELDTNYVAERQVDVNNLDKKDLIITYTNNEKNRMLSKIEGHYGIGQKLIATRVLKQIKDGYEDLDDDKDNSYVIYAQPTDWWVQNEIVEIVGNTDKYTKVKRWDDSVELIQGEQYKFWKSAQAITCHKVQGQTLTCDYIIDLDDFAKCTNIEERTKLLYVAVSRAQKLSQIRFIGKLPIITALVQTIKNVNKFDINENVKNLEIFSLLSNQNLKVYNLVYSIGVSNIVNLSARDVAKICEISQTMVCKWKKSGWNNYEIIKKYKPELLETENSIEKDTLEANLNEKRQEFNEIDDKRWDFKASDPRNKYYNDRATNYFNNQYAEAFQNLKDFEALEAFYLEMKKLQEKQHDSKCSAARASNNSNL